MNNPALLERRRRRWRLLPVLAACVVCLGATSRSCEIGRDDNDIDEEDLSFSTTLTLQNADGDVLDSFGPGDEITMVLTVRNRLDEDVTLRFDSTRTVEFIVLDPATDNPLWRALPDDDAEEQVSTRLTFEAGETREFEVTWNQTDDFGNALTLGEYEARGVIVFDEYDVDPLAEDSRGSAPVSFTIE